VITQKRSTGTLSRGFRNRGSIPISQFAFYGILGICYNLAFVLHPCPHDSNYPDLWNINYYSEKRKDLFPLFTPSFTPNRYAGGFWASCATIGQVAMRSSSRPQHFIKFLRTGDHVLKKEQESTKHQLFIPTYLTEKMNLEKKTIMKRKG